MKKSQIEILEESLILEKVLQMTIESLEPVLSDNFSLIMNRLIENRHLKNDKQEYHELHKESAEKIHDLADTKEDCRHSKMGSIRDDGMYECLNCGDLLPF
jgi:adenosyl cobinamide kinase/adenosyl cobinamide phosphate guanylyltransferase